MIGSSDRFAALFGACLILAASAGGAHADAPAARTPSGAFGNTVVSTYPDGRKARLWLNPDGSYTAAGRRGTPSSGSWRVKGDKMCLKQAKPRAVPFAFCTPMASGGVGASWNAKAVTGEPIRVTVVAGR